MYRTTPFIARRGGESIPVSSEFWLRPTKQKKNKKRPKAKSDELAQEHLSVGKDVSHVTKYDEPSTPFRFLDLPPEIRNKIYKYAMTVTEFTVEMKPLQAPYIARDLRLDHQSDEHHTIIQCDDRYLGRNTPEDRERRLIFNQSSPITGLHLVNKQMKFEAIPHLYSVPTFYMQSLKSARRFMKMAGRNNALDSITSLSIGIGPYGQPSSHKLMKWVKTYHRSTAGTINEMALRMPNVLRLSVVVDIPNDSPARLTFREDWCQPLFNFSKFTKVKEIYIRVQLFEVKSMLECRTRVDRSNLQILQTLQLLFSEAITRRIGGLCESCACEEMFSQTTDDENELCRKLKVLSQSSIFYRQILDWSWIDHGEDVINKGDMDSTPSASGGTTEEEQFVALWSNLDIDVFS